MEVSREDVDEEFEFIDKTIRMAFIRKVYSILMCQLTVTFGFIALCIFHQPTQKFILTHPALWWVALAVLLVTVICLACCGEMRRRPPLNFILLTLYTVAQAFMLGVAASYFNISEVLFAVGLTAVVCLTLTLFAFQTKIDFTGLGVYLLVFAVILLVLGIFALIFKERILNLVYASLGVLLFSVYLIYDTQLMIGGNHKYSISPEEYIFAALSLYIDIINIFSFLLVLIRH